MKLAAALILAMLLNTSLWAQTSEQMSVPLSQPGRPYKLDVSLVDGSITVVGYEGKDIVISVQTEGDKRNNSHERSDGLRRLSAGNRADIQAEESNNSVSVHGMVGRVTNLTLKVPANDVTLKLGTVNNGKITVSNVSGELELSDVNDAIKCTNISGSVVANTVNGNVVVVFKSIDPKAAMAFSTLNGNVDVTFPAGLKANVKLKSDRGEVYTDFDVATEHRAPAVNHNNNGGKGLYSLKIDEWIYGKIDGGGPEIMMKNMNGNIYIRKAK